MAIYVEKGKKVLKMDFVKRIRRFNRTVLTERRGKRWERKSWV